MFRPYTPKDDVQRKSYYSDRFYVPKEIAKEPITDDQLTADIDQLAQSVGVIESYALRSQAIVIVEAAKSKAALAALQAQGYTMLMEMSAVDFLASRGEFEIFYQLLSVTKNRRIRVKTAIKEGQAIDSVSDLWRSANWSEREMYDMFGIIASGHPHLSRILMPNDWVGFPLRKTYPLQGDEFAQWYEVDKIYGKEFREKIGAENRDAGRVDRDDTRNFARVGFEVPFDTEPTDEPTPISYIEKRKLLYSDFDPNKQKVLEKRK